MEVALGVAVLELDGQGCLVRPISMSAIVLFLSESIGSGAVYSLAAIPGLFGLTRYLCILELEVLSISERLSCSPRI